MFNVQFEIETGLKIIGIVIIALFIIIIKWKLLKGVWTCGLGHSLGFGVKWRPGPGVWAVVTGATDGIGLEYAKAFAKMGYSVLIISRSEEKLKSVANDIIQQCPMCKEVKILAINFISKDVYPLIAEVIDSLEDIDVLVNNVGIMYPITEYFTQIPSITNESYFNVNMWSQVKMCEIILPKMIKQKRGIIINLSSIGADFPGPMFTTYAATKAFNDFFSRGLSLECSQKGVTIQTVCPGFVSTNLVVKNLDKQMMVTPEQFVSAAIKTVGIEWRTYGHWKHKVMAFSIKLLIQLIGTKMLLKILMINFKMGRDKYYKDHNMIDNF